MISFVDRCVRESSVYQENSMIETLLFAFSLYSHLYHKCFHHFPLLKLNVAQDSSWCSWAFEHVFFFSTIQRCWCAAVTIIGRFSTFDFMVDSCRFDNPFHDNRFAGMRAFFDIDIGKRAPSILLYWWIFLLVGFIYYYYLLSHNKCVHRFVDSIVYSFNRMSPSWSVRKSVCVYCDRLCGMFKRHFNFRPLHVRNTIVYRVQVNTMAPRSAHTAVCIKWYLLISIDSMVLSGWVALKSTFGVRRKFTFCPPIELSVSFNSPKVDFQVRTQLRQLRLLKCRISHLISKNTHF